MGESPLPWRPAALRGRQENKPRLLEGPQFDFLRVVGLLGFVLGAIEDLCGLGNLCQKRQLLDGVGLSHRAHSRFNRLNRLCHSASNAKPAPRTAPGWRLSGGSQQGPGTVREAGNENAIQSPLTVYPGSPC